MSAVRSTQTPRLGLNKPDPGGDVDVWGEELNANADILDGALLANDAASIYLPLAGGTMTGPLTLAGAPVNSLDAVTKVYADSMPPFGGPYLQIGGGTMTGPLALAGPPTQPPHAASKAYVDSVTPAGGPFLALAGGTMNGPLALAGTPTQPLHAASKAYVDGAAPAGGPYLALAGGAMAGLLLLAGDPAANLGAATKQYVDNAAPLGGPYLPLTGGTLTGTLTLATNLHCGGNAVIDVDTTIGRNASVAGTLTLAADPTAASQAATKRYVDNAAPLGGPYLAISGGTLTGPLGAPVVITSGTPGGLPTFANNELMVTADSGAVNAMLLAFAGGASLTFGRAGGSKASPAALAAGGTILSIGSTGFDGAAWPAATALYTQNAAGNAWTTSDHGTIHVWRGTPAGSIVTAEYMRLDDGGALLVGRNVRVGTSTSKLQVLGGATLDVLTLAVSTTVTGPTITCGAAAPASTQPAGSIYLRTAGAAGTRIYVNQDGAATWLPIAGV